MPTHGCVCTSGDRRSTIAEGTNTWMCWHLRRSAIDDRRRCPEQILRFLEVGWSQRLGLSNTLLGLLYSGVYGCGDTHGDHRETERNHHWGRTWRTKFFPKAIIGMLGLRRLGLSNTLLGLLYSGVCGCCTIETPKATIIGDTHGETNSDNNHHWEVWVAAVGRKQPLQRELYERRRLHRRLRLVVGNTDWELLVLGVVCQGQVRGKSGASQRRVKVVGAGQRRVRGGSSLTQTPKP